MVIFSLGGLALWVRPRGASGLTPALRPSWGRVPAVPLSEALPRAVAGLGCEALPAPSLEDVLRRLSDPRGVWEALWVMGS